MDGKKKRSSLAKYFSYNTSQPDGMEELDNEEQDEFQDKVNALLEEENDQNMLSKKSYSFSHLLGRTTTVKEETDSDRSVVPPLQRSSTGGITHSIYRRFRRSKQSSRDVYGNDSFMDDLNPIVYYVKAPIGSCVSTKYGTGRLIEFRESDGFHVVKLADNSIAYFHCDSVYGEIKAMAREKVKTQWGLGTVENYYPETDLYEIALDWRWDDDHVWRMKATAEKFEVVDPNATSLLQKTSYYLSEGYSSIVESTTSSVNTMKSKFSKPKPQAICNIFCPFGDVALLRVRDDNVHIARTNCGAVAFIQQEKAIYYKKSSIVAVGDRLDTRYGKGTVIRQRPDDGMFIIDLDWKLLDNKPVKLYMCTQEAEHCKGGGGGRFSSIFYMGRKIRSAGATATGGLSTVKAKMMRITGSSHKSQFSLGERVLTQFGSGYVKGIRYDDVYIIKLRRLQVLAYLHENKVSSFPYHKVSHYIVEGKRQPLDKPINGEKQARQLMRQVTSVEALKSARGSM